MEEFEMRQKINEFRDNLRSSIKSEKLKKIDENRSKKELLS